ncbi:hypothetical protein [Helicobacter sp. MIT 05-5294]|uniref:hypothetical protein n=1 Tax=Helicobacter sp. MIT 05-5294 TaxID=1548150 RepID=UPI00051F9881|nr:hypothetical protein [Helicobacter sp. MIT 05-5294]TLD85792.1 hypothetical protein LS69_007810 [Helicobacter sp. MIT 05-5294]
MFSSENLYQLLKPKDNQDLITNYEVVIGGGGISANFNKGVIILNFLQSKPVSSNIRSFKDLDKKEFLQGLEHYSRVSEYSFVQSDYQIDVYKKNAQNILFIECEKEALKIRQWLNSYEVLEYLRDLESEILPAYSVIRFSNEMIENKLVQRASFDFSIITKVEISEAVGVVDKATIGNFNIIKGIENG